MPFARRMFKATIAAVICLNSAAIFAQDGLSLRVVTSDEPNLHTNFSLIMGEENMVLVDAPFSNSAAHRLVADLLETGKNLTHIAGDLVFHGIHAWLGETLEPQRLAWAENLEKLMEIDADVVVAGHKLPHLEDDPEALEFTRDYILDFNREAKTAGTSENLIARMRSLYPDVQDVLDNFILINSAQVGVGEVPPWEE